MDATRLKQLATYDPETGHFVWKESRGRRKRGAIAGSHCNKGYLVIGVDYKVYKAHRLAWLYMTGEWPTDQIDHRNTRKDDNRWDNLRQASNQQNCCNRDRYNKTGFRNVSIAASGRFIASVARDGKTHHLGVFDTPEEAYAAASAARIKHHGEFAHH